MASRSFFPQLREVVSNIQKIPDLEKNTERSIHFDGNCRPESRRKMFDIHEEMTKLRDNSLKVNSDLKLQGHKTAKLIHTAEAILSYLEEKTLKVQEKLKTMGYKPVRDILNNGENLKESSQKTGESTAEIDNKDKEDNENDELNLPRSPSFGKLLPSYKDKELGRNSLDSPELPCLKSEPWQKSQSSYKNSVKLCEESRKTFFDDIHGSSPDSHHEHEERTVHARKHKLWNDSELPISPLSPVQFKKAKIENELNDAPAEAQLSNKHRRRFFDTPQAATAIDAVKPQLTSMLKPAPRFPPLTDSPKTPGGYCATTTNPVQNVGKTKLATERESPAFQIYSRRSMFSDEIEERNSIDDDTVILLNCQARAMKTQNKKLDFPKIPARKYFGYAAEAELDSPQTPELKCKLQNREKLSDIVSHTPYETCVIILEKEYEQLPNYLKRPISLELSRQCLEMAYKNSTPMSGDKSVLVITEAKLTEVTHLAGKIQTFICQLTKLGIVKKISGTDLFQFMG